MNSGTSAGSRSHCSNSGAISPRQYLLPSDLRASITSSWLADYEYLILNFHTDEHSALDDVT